MDRHIIKNSLACKKHSGETDTTVALFCFLSSLFTHLPISQTWFLPERMEMGKHACFQKSQAVFTNLAPSQSTAESYVSKDGTAQISTSKILSTVPEVTLAS